MPYRSQRTERGSDPALGPGRTGPLPPDFLILGARKCGTTSLASALRLHPQVFIPQSKEAHHFGSVGDSDVGGEAYRAFFREWSGQPVGGEATPTYLYWSRSAEQICRFLPGVKGIVVLRDPDDRERILVLFLDEFVSDGASALREVQQFPGIGVHVSSFPQRSASGRHLLPRPLLRVLAPRWRSLWVGRILDRTCRPFVPPPMDPEVRARLVEYYRPHNARLAQLLGRELPHWDR